MKDIYIWHNDLYPLVKKRFDLRYAKRLGMINQICDTISLEDINYCFEGFDRPKPSKEEEKEDKSNA